MKKYILIFSLFISNLYATPLIIAHKGFHNVVGRPRGNKCYTYYLYDRGAPYRFSDGTIQKAFDYGADYVEIDFWLTKDHHLVLFHDQRLDCKSNLKGDIGNWLLADINQQVYASYNVSLDGGKTFPFRKTKKGLLTFKHILTHYPGKNFLLNPKNRNLLEAQVIEDRIEKYASKDSSFFLWGSPKTFKEINKKKKYITTFINNHKQSEICLRKFRITGWIGLIPLECKNTTLSVELRRMQLIWGWPDHFIKMMHTVNTQVFFYLPRFLSYEYFNNLYKTDLDGIITSEIKVIHNIIKKNPYYLTYVFKMP